MNKPQLLIFKLLMFLTPALWAQEQKFELGISGGPNYLYFKSNDIYKKYRKPETGYTAGISFQYHFTKILSLTTGILFEDKKSKAALPDNYIFNFRANWRESSNSIEQQYLNLPLLLKTSFGKKRLLFVNTGVYFGYVFTDYFSQNYSSPAATYKDHYGTENANHDHLFDFGLSLGAGFRIPLGHDFSISGEIRDNIGLLNTRKIPYPPVKLNTANLLLNLNYCFGTKRKFNDTIPKGKRFFIKFFYAPQSSFRFAQGKTTSFYIQNIYGGSTTTMSYRASQERPRYASELGMHLEFKIRKHFNFTTGLTFDKQSYQTTNTIDSIHLNLYSDITFPSTYTYHNMPKIIYTFKFLTLPLILNYEMKHKKTTYSAGLGSEIKYLYKKSIAFPPGSTNPEILNDDGNVPPGSRWTVFYTVNLGASIPINSKKFLIIEPYYKFQAQDMLVTPYELITRLWSTGCRLGIKF